MEEKELIALVKAGEKEVYRELVTLHKVRIHRFCYRLVQEPEEAQDLTQETFIQAFRKIHLYQPTGTFYSWLYSIAYRLFLTMADKKRRRKESEPMLEESMLYLAKINNEPPSSEQGDQGKVRYALMQMDESYRQPLLLRYQEQLGPDEIANVMKISPLAVKSRLYRGKQLLAKALTALKRREEINAL